MVQPQNSRIRPKMPQFGIAPHGILFSWGGITIHSEWPVEFGTTEKFERGFGSVRNRMAPFALGPGRFRPTAAGPGRKCAPLQKNRNAQLERMAIHRADGRCDR